MSNGIRSILPGVALLLAIGLIARGITLIVPSVDHLILAIVIGAIVTNSVGIPIWARPGVEKSKLLLEIGIVLMGGTLLLDAILDAGPIVLVSVPMIVVFSILIVELISRNLFGITSKLSSLMAAGMSICGVSAAIAVAAGIKANEENIAYAVATILLFDAVTLFTYPLIGQFLGLPDLVFGVWAGLSMFSTGPVVAAGFAYSTEAGQWATITKLTRNLCLSFVVIIYVSYYARWGSSATESNKGFGLLWQKFPKFVIGFIVLIAIANIGILTDPQIESIENAYQWFFLLAFAGLGLQISIDDMRGTGFRPILAVSVSLVIVSVVSLLLLLTLL